MKALSLTDPWGTLILLGAKKIETRSFRVSHRDRLAIHVSKGFPKYAREACYEEPFRSVLAPHFSFNSPLNKQFPLGCVIATCRLVDCVKTEEFGKYSSDCVGFFGPRYAMPSEQELAFGDYSPGRYAWILADIQPLPEQIPAKGALGLWEWNGQ